MSVLHGLTPQQLRYTDVILARALARARSAMIQFPQPNYMLLKVAEEAGEVVKTGVHLAEGRDFTPGDLEDEVVDTIAMCLRLLLEGDETIKLPPSCE
jgi:hypothetical protein